MAFVLPSQNRNPTILLMYCYFDPVTGQGRCRGIEIEFTSHDTFMRYRQNIENLINEMASVGTIRSQLDVGLREFSGVSGQSRYYGFEVTTRMEGEKKTPPIHVPLF